MCCSYGDLWVTFCIVPGGTGLHFPRSATRSLLAFSRQYHCPKSSPCALRNCSRVLISGSASPESNKHSSAPKQAWENFSQQFTGRKIPSDLLSSDSLELMKVKKYGDDERPRNSTFFFFLSLLVAFSVQACVLPWLFHASLLCYGPFTGINVNCIIINT